MHGLVLRALQLYVTDCHGPAVWRAAAHVADLGFDECEAMLTYEDSTAPRLLSALCAVLDRPREEVLEDIGTYLVSHPSVEALRRLLRFGGVDFLDFLHSLDDLPGRARLAVPDLDLPELELREHSTCHFTVISNSKLDGMGHVLVGMLRAMADDYGALALVEHRSGGQGIDVLGITLAEADFADGRDFDLGDAAA